MYLFRTKIFFLGLVWRRKRELDWETFDQFKTDNKSVKFIQDVYPNKELKAEEVTVICDCVEGIRGKMCLHSVAQYYRLGMMKKPSLIPENQRFSKATHGKVPGARKQIRF